jgi:beta-xylosidase
MLVLLATGAALLAITSAARGAVIHSGRSTLSCPDPSVIAVQHQTYRYYMACTSNDQLNVFPVRGSNDLVHWQFISYVFPAGQYPSWATAPPQAAYWAPDIHWMNGHWMVYFAATAGAGATPMPVHGHTPMVIGVAWANTLTGPWHSKLLYYAQQFVIDPGEFQDPHTGQRFLVVAQEGVIYTAKLSQDGLTFDWAHMHSIFWGRPGTWDRYVEGPSIFYHNGNWYLLYSAGYTYDATYSVGVAISSDPLTRFYRLNRCRPILRSSQTWLGPGGPQNPVRGPDGHWYLFYHAESQVNPRGISAWRMLLVSAFWWKGIVPQVGNSYAAS